MKQTGIVKVPILSDGADPVGTIQVHRAHLDQLALESKLDTWILESVRFYACEDGPVLVIWGTHNHRLAIRGITMDVGSLHESSQFRVLWEKYRAKELKIADIHKDILTSVGNAAN